VTKESDELTHELLGYDEQCPNLAKRKGWVRKNSLPVNLALQGGGSHGAFTWGVLDRLLEDGRISFEAVSGTSAGAVNAVILADGMERGGPDGAREALANFWEAVSERGRYSPIQRNPFDVLFGNWSLDNSPSYLFFDMMSRLVSPYVANPMNLNPLRDLLEEAVDFERLRCCSQTKLFISATNVHTGKVRVFGTPEMTPDVILASACLPFLFQAVEIDDVPYWDGGFMGNPVMFPFFNHCSTNDVLLIQINPMIRPHTPKSARDILNRVNEITFNASLLKEFRAIEFVYRLIDKGLLDPKDYRQVRLHRIAAEGVMGEMSASSKLNTEWRFLQHLFQLGRAEADAFLTGDVNNIGHRPSVDVRALLNLGHSAAAAQ